MAEELRAVASKSKSKPSSLTQARLRELLVYDEETGVFTWKVTVGSRAIAGSVVPGCKTDSGHLYIQVDKQRHRAHRLAWLYVYGQLPFLEVDHINRNPADNRISNLRLATPSENAQNSGVRRDNKSGVRGVSWYSQTQKWMAKITVNGKQKGLGYYKSLEDAKNAYLAAARESFPVFGGSV